MYCSKCGKQISNKDGYCSSCGYGTSFISVTDTNESDSVSSDYVKIQEFYSRATTIRNLGIASIILMFGFAGPICSIVALAMSGDAWIPDVDTDSKYEIERFQEAKKRYKLGKTLASIPLWMLGISIVLGLVVLAVCGT